MIEFALVRWRSVVVIGLLACGATFLSGQKSSQPPVLQRLGSDVTVLRTNVRRVVLDVVVTGKNGEPVRGLTKGDFSVKEDDKPQTIRSFDVHDFDSGPEFVPPKVPPLGANTYLNLPKEPEKGPLYLILYDMWNMSLVEQSIGRKQLLAFINNKPEGTRFAIIVLSDGMNLVQGFTSDKNALLAMLDPKTSRPHVPQVFLNGGNYGAPALDVFEELAHYLEGFPGRKNVIWFSGGFPLSLFAHRTDLGDGEYSEEVKEVVDTLARDQISIYPVDVRGVIIDRPYMVTWSSYKDADALAEATGGHAYYGNNDVTGLLEKATVNGASYYTLSYAPTNEKYDGKVRKIHVELAKKGYALAYRRSYFGVDKDMTPTADATPLVALAGTRGSIPQDDRLSMEIRLGAPMAHDLLFRAQFHVAGPPALATPEQMSRLVEDPGALRRQLKNQPVKLAKPIPLQTYTVDYRVMDAQAKSRGSTTGASPVLEFVAAAFDVDGNMVSGVLQNASRQDSDGKAEPNQAKFFSVQQQLDVPLKAAWIRVAVRDLSTDHVGTLEVRLPLEKEPAADAAAGDAPAVGKPASN